MKKQHLKVSSNEEGQTLLAFLRTHLKSSFSVKAIKRAIDGKHCTVNGRVEFFSTYRVRKGEIVEIEVPETIKKVIPEVLYEDEEMIAYNKPSGLSSEKLPRGKLVHRLDKDTTGVILLAKKEISYAALIEQFAKREVEKKYLLICDGVIKQKKWKCDDYLSKKAVYQGGVIYDRAKEKKEGKRAITVFECKKIGKKASLLEAYPITGRTHQLRVQCKLMGHPILGDWQYASRFVCPYRPERFLLHAHQITFFHPKTKQKMVLIAPIPEDFLQAEKILFEGEADE